MSAYIQSNQPITLPTGNVTISATDAGKIFLIPAQGAASITLPTGASTPPAVPGMHYRFIMAGAAAGAITIGTGAAGGLGGVALTGNSTVPVVAANITVDFQILRHLVITLTFIVLVQLHGQCQVGRKVMEESQLQILLLERGKVLM